jgi:Fic family protein
VFYAAAEFIDGSRGFGLHRGPARNDHDEEHMRSRYLDIEDRTQDLAELLRDEPAIAQDFSRRYELSWLYHDSALEGVVYTGQEIEIALAGQPLAEAGTIALFREIRNAKAAIELVRAEAAQKKPKITLALVKQLNATLHAGNEARATAEFRKDIPLHRAYFHEIAPPPQIAHLFGALIDATESSEFKNLHPIQRAAKLQHGFMHVYPYTEGSGRIARLLSNLVLLNAGYQPCVIHTIDRQRYYESLKQTDSSLRELMMESMENGLTSAEKYCREALALRRKLAR